MSRDGKSLPITALIITRNEERAIGRCIRAAAFCDQIVVVDSYSTDDTAAVAASYGATVLLFQWNGQYPKKKQWGMSHPEVRNDWVLHLDADEVVSGELEDEIRSVFASNEGGPLLHRAYEVPLSYYFMGKQLRHGHRVTKRSLVDRRHTHFPEIGDLSAPGITEVEGHYQPLVSGATATLKAHLVHQDPDPIRDWVSRHNRYSDWEAYLGTHDQIRNSVRGLRSRQGQVFDRVPLKPVAFFIYCYMARLGFLDGRAGLRYALSLTWYYWLTGVKLDEMRSGALESNDDR